MDPLVHYQPDGTSRPVCGATEPEATTTSSAATTCGACLAVITTPRKPTPHGRTNR